MAFIVKELKIASNPFGTGGQAVLTGTFESTMGSTGGTISPGNEGASPNESLVAARGIRKIDHVNITITSLTVTPASATITFNAGQQGDIVTVVTGMNDTGTFQIFGEMNGS